MQLRRYLQANDMSVSAFAEAIGVTNKAVYKYLSGKRQPSRRRLELIAVATRGAVTPNDFYQLPSSAHVACETRA